MQLLAVLCAVTAAVNSAVEEGYCDVVGKICRRGTMWNVDHSMDDKVIVGSAVRSYPNTPAAAKCTLRCMKETSCGFFFYNKEQQACFTCPKPCHNVTLTNAPGYRLYIARTQVHIGPSNSGTFSSPNYPHAYDDYLDILYVVTLQDNGPQTVTATINYDLEINYDYIKFNNDENHKYWGQGNRTVSFQISGNMWYAHFYTDYSITRSGFNVQYNVTG